METGSDHSDSFTISGLGRLMKTSEPDLSVLGQKDLLTVKKDEPAQSPRTVRRNVKSGGSTESVHQSKPLERAQGSQSMKRDLKTNRGARSMADLHVGHLTGHGRARVGLVKSQDQTKRLHDTSSSRSKQAPSKKKLSLETGKRVPLFPKKPAGLLGAPTLSKQRETHKQDTSLPKPMHNLESPEAPRDVSLSTMFMHYTISEDLSGTQDSIMTQKLAVLAEKSQQETFDVSEAKDEILQKTLSEVLTTVMDLEVLDSDPKYAVDVGSESEAATRLIVGPFLELPPRKEYPDYYLLIRKPISIVMIQEKIRDHVYKSLMDLADDLELLAINAKTYNEDGSMIHADATLIQHVTGEAIAKQLDDHHILAL